MLEWSDLDSEIKTAGLANVGFPFPPPEFIAEFPTLCRTRQLLLICKCSVYATLDQRLSVFFHRLVNADMR